jgi:hypothetical protein
MMDDLENRPMSEEDNAAVDMGRESALAARKAAQLAKQAEGESFDSDVRAQNQANRMPSSRLPEDIQEEDEYDEKGGDTQRKRRANRRRGKKDQYYVEEITRRDVDMAGAYGGIAKPRIRKVPGGIKLKAMARETQDKTPQGPLSERPNVGRSGSQNGQLGAPQMGNLFSAGKQGSESGT